MPIGSTNVYYPGDLILSTVSSSGTSFIETKIVASTSSLIYFDNNARINSASLSSFTFGSSSYSLTSSYSVYAETASNAQNAQDILVYVKNTSGAIITKGSLVRIKDVENSGFNPTIELASFTNESGSANTLGYAYQQFAINDLGYVITEGKLTGVNTGNFSPGDLLYLSSSGQYTNVKPIPPNHGVRVGQVIRAHPTVGSIYVTIDNGAELDELHNVIDNSTTSSYGDLLTKSGSVWINSKNLTGSYTLSGSLTTNGAISALNVTASLLGTASWANNSISSSYSLTSSYINLSSSNVFVQGGNSFGTTALLGTNDAQSLALETNGTTRMSINSNGNVAINTSTSPSVRLSISDTHQGSLGSSSLSIATGQNQNQGLATSANDSGITNVYTVNNFTSSTAIQNQASFDQIIIAGSGSFSGSYRASRNGTLLSNTASLDSGGNITNTYLTNQISPNIPTFSIPNWTAGTQTYVDLITGNTTGSITNLYNHQIGSPFPSGGAGGITVTNSYGVYINKQKTTNIVTNGWGIYQADTGDLNIFAGKTRIGSTTTPVNTLDVTGNISASVVTASLFFGTSSWANNSISASYAVTASYVNISSSNVFLQGGNSFGTTALLGTNDAQPLVFETSGSERMRILSGGNIGIGTSAASELLDVYRLNTGGWNPRIVARDGTNAAFIGVYSGQPGVFAHNNALNAWANLYLNTSDPTNSVGSGNVFIGGNVGIGTTTPTALLDVSYGDYQNAGTLRLGADIGVNRSRTNNSRKYGSITGFPYNNFSASIQAIGIDAIDSSQTGLTIGGGSVSFASPTQIQFYTTSSTTAPGAERMRIDSGGNVGIGTTSPITKLHVYSPVAGAGSERTTPIDVLTLESENTTAQEFTGFGQSIVFRGSTYNNNTQRTLGKILHQINDDSVSTTRGTSLDFQLLTHATGSTLASRMYIKYDGNVGIGTSSPAFLLDVSGSSRHGFTSTNVHQFTGSVNINGSLFSDANITASNISASGNIIASRITSSNVLINGNLTVTGSIFASLFSASYIYITSSTLVVTDNIITLNALSPYQRYAGMEMYDSGSGNLSSFLWDGQGDYFFITGSGVNGKLITGPDGQTDLTSNYVPKATAGYKLGNSLIYDDGTNIGIGTPTPIQKLHVVGSTLITNNNYHYGYTLAGAQSNLIGISSADNILVGQSNVNHANTIIYGGLGVIDLNTSGSTRMRVTYDGNVGIGTTSPVTLLTVGSTTTTTSSMTLQGEYQSSVFNNTNIFNFRHGGFDRWRLITVQNSAASNDFDFRINSLNSATTDYNAYVTVKGLSGNVGLGVTNPSGRLHITASATSAESLIYLSKGSGSISQNFITAVNEINQASYRVTSDINGYTQQTLYRNGTAYVYHDAYWSSYINNANYTQGGLGIGTTSQTHGYGVTIARPATSGSLYVSGSSVFTGSVGISGSINLSGPIIYDNAVLLDFGRTTTPAISTNYVVLQNITGSYNSAFFDYFASSASNFRAGTVIAGWSGSSINYTEYSTTDIGNTNQLTMSVDLSSSFVRLLTTVSTTTNWNIKSSGRYL